MSNPQYAPNPKNQKVYRNLQNKKLSDVTAKDIQQLTDPTFIQATNQDALITYNMLNEAMMRNGLPMPATAKIVQAESTTSSAVIEIFTPNKGEVWKVEGFAFNKTGLAGTVAARLIADDGNQITSIDMSMIYLSSTQDPASANEDNFHTFHVDENITLRGTAYFGGGFPTGEKVIFQVYLVRVR